ncbi:MAG TPA: cell division protein FtsQ/DivIB [Baekduia sp.]|nr:cell division protein FtsQ/DivIB [Baekduia sp.]
MAGLLVTLAVLGVGFLLVRDSSLVRVQRVQVQGLTGPEAAALQRSLAQAGKDMSTLNVDREALEAIVEPHPVVRGLSVQPDFPHGLRITVHERTPVAVVQSGGDEVLVSSDGTLLRGARPRDLAVIPMRAAPGGDRITDRRALQAVAALAAAPPQLRPRVARAFTGSHGLTLQLEEGPSLRFGSLSRLRAKWASAARVLGDAGSRGATYLDLRYPERPAAGGLEDPESQLDPDAEGQSVTVPGVETPGGAAAPAATPAAPAAPATPVTPAPTGP